MILLLSFSFLAGFVTILSPCILPILPVVLGSSVGSKDAGYQRPIGTIIGFIASFTFFTLFLASIVKILNVPGDTLRVVSIIVITGFGLTLIIQKLREISERLFAKLSGNFSNNTQKHGLFGGLIVGLSLGILWTPCVGPILASVISLAITGTVTINTFLITLAYSVGTAIPMLAIMIGGRSLLNKVPFFTKNTLNIQKAFGVVMIATALGISFNIDRKIQTIVLNLFPKYGINLTKIEDNSVVQKALNVISKNAETSNKLGLPSNSYLQDKSKKAPEIIPGGEWFNSQPLTLDFLKGKVVLIDFWTYSCINCQRTFPYLKSWWNKYKDKGLVIIGVHSPEFEFEKNSRNVRQALNDFGLEYPIVQDNNFDTWKAYNNRFWPAKYFIDRDGYIRSTHFGEGDYDESEKIIQQLLNEVNETPITDQISNPDYEIYAKTPESYIGYSRINNLVSPETILKDGVRTYSAPKILASNMLAFEGNWLITPEYGNPTANATLLMNFNAKDVFLVMRTKGKSSKVKVFVDGETKYFGKDNLEGIVTIDSDRLYNLITLPTPGAHILKLEFLDNDTEVYAFTFG